ncbi:hypothetical protein [Dendronalium sp. ChiSLP03b]|nr:hypothetical protein [Dendronalium sp. ChiSLP03b]
MSHQAGRYEWQDEGAGEAGGELLTPSSCTDAINRVCTPNF